MRIKVLIGIIWVFGQQASLQASLPGVSWRTNIDSLVPTNPQEAIAFFEQRISIAHQENQPLYEAKILTQLGSLFINLENYHQAASTFLDALKLLEKEGSTEELIEAKTALAEAYNKTEQYQQAKQLLDAVLKTPEGVCLDRVKIRAFYNLGYYFERASFEHMALVYYQKGLKQNRDFGHAEDEPLFLEHIGKIYLQLEDMPIARSYFMAARKMYMNTLNELALSSCNAHIGDSYFKEQRLSIALSWYTKALGAANANGQKRQQAHCCQRLAQVYTQQQDYVNANAYNLQYAQCLKEFHYSSKLSLTAQMQALYRLTSKENELAYAKLKRQKQIKHFAITLLLLITAFLIVIWRANRRYLGMNKKLVIQKKKLEKQRDIIAVKKSRLDKQKKVLESSIEYALTIQAAMLPTSKQMRDAMDYFLVFRPKDIVSGDFYWIRDHSDEPSQSLYVAVVDCTGHGVPAAFMSVIGERLLQHIIVDQRVVRTDDILEQLDIEVKHMLKQEYSTNRDGMDICLCRIRYIDDRDVIVNYTGAKRPLYFYRQLEGKLETARGTLRSIGGRKQKVKVDFEQQELCLNKNDMLYLLTDGMMDQHNPERKKFGYQHALAMLEECGPLPTMLQWEYIINTLEDFQQDAEQRDDIVLLGISL